MLQAMTSLVVLLSSSTLSDIMIRNGSSSNTNSTSSSGSSSGGTCQVLKGVIVSSGFFCIQVGTIVDVSFLF